MKEIAERLEALHAAYQRQHQIYTDILTGGALEGRYIDQGDMANLLPLLTRKHEQMEAAAADDGIIRRIQQELAVILQLEAFSLSQAKEAVPTNLREHVERLTEVVAAVVASLEALEQQEREFEGELQQWLQGPEELQQQQQSTAKRRAKRAYKPQS